jgi:hypothetical protein
VKFVSSIQLDNDIKNRVQRTGYAVVEGKHFQVSSTLRRHWPEFAETWNDLPPDEYLGGGAPRRLRRYSCLSYSPLSGAMSVMQDATFRQSKLFNPLFGGMERKFAPLRPETLRNPYLTELIDLVLRQWPISDIQKELNWSVGVHQIRIASQDNQPAGPTPEGIHRDGYQFVSIHFIARRNVLGGVSNVYDNQSSLLDSFTLSAAMDSIFIDDRRVMHDATPILPERQDLCASRDTLILTYDCVSEVS